MEDQPAILDHTGEPMSTNGHSERGRASWVQITCIIGIVGTIHLGLLGIIVITIMGKEAPPSLPSIVGVAIGALANALAPVRRVS